MGHEVEVVSYVIQNNCDGDWQDEGPIEAFNTLDEAIYRATHFAKQCMHLKHRIVKRTTKRVVIDDEIDEELITFQPLEDKH